MKVPKFIVKNRVIILIISLILMIPALFGMISTRVNYDLLSYLPSDIDTMVGQEKLKEEFGAGAFSFIIFNNMPDSDIAKVSDQIKTSSGTTNPPPASPKNFSPTKSKKSSPPPIRRVNPKLSSPSSLIPAPPKMPPWMLSLKSAT